MLVKDWGIISQHLAAKYMQIVAICMKMKDVWRFYTAFEEKKKVDAVNADAVRANINSQLKTIGDLEGKFLETNVDVSLMITANVTSLEQLQIPEILQKFNSVSYTHLRAHET